MNLPMLYELQGLQREIDVIDKRLKELIELKDLDKFKKEYKRLKAEYLDCEEKLKENSIRQEVRNNDIKNLENSRKTSEEIKFSRDTDTIKKLENIEKHLEKLKEKKQEAEDDIIALINEADNTNKEMLETKKKLVFIKKKYLSSKEKNDKEIEKLEKIKAELGSKIELLAEKTDKESYEIYQRLIKFHSDPIAPVEKRLCSGCKMEVPAMDYEALKSGSQGLKCQSCGRLLFYRKPLK